MEYIVRLFRYLDLRHFGSREGSLMTGHISSRPFRRVRMREDNQFMERERARTLVRRE
jgi:hypothetical protein